ncbi:MAG: type IV secretion system protein [Gammaproteobacteria bacterium]
MDIPNYANWVMKLLSFTDDIINNYVYNGYNTLAEHLRKPLGLAIILYFCVMGVSITNGWLRLSMSNLMKSAFKLSLIYTFAMNWSLFSHYIVGGIETTASQLGSWLVGATPIPLPHYSGEGLNAALQAVFIEVTKVGQLFWNIASFRHLPPYFTAIMIWFFGYLGLLFAFLETLLAQIMLAILFTLAPLFIGFTLFKSTHPMFDRWLGMVFGFALFLVFIPAALALTISIVHWSIAGQYANHLVDTSVVAYVPVAVVGILSVLIIKYVTHYALAIGSGVITASGTGSSMMAGAIGTFVGGSVSGLRFVSAPLRSIGKNHRPLGSRAIKVPEKSEGVNKFKRGEYQ